MIFFKILKFHDISMTGKATVIFPGFQGFPGAVGTLHFVMSTIFSHNYYSYKMVCIMISASSPMEIDHTDLVGYHIKINH